MRSQRLKNRNGITLALAAAALLAGLAGAEDRRLDTRSFTAAWSAERKLNTKKIVGTMLFLR
jgi:hypothetical protein